MLRGDEAGIIGQHEVDGAFVFVANDIACAVAEGQLGILVVVGSKFCDAAFDGGCDGISRELVAFDDPAGF